MKIAFYGSSLLSSYWNGAATYYRGLLKAFLDNDVDPCDLRGRDPEIDRLMDEIDPEL